MTDTSGSDISNAAVSENHIPKTIDIQHLVMSSGVIYGFTFFGILKKMHQTGKINLFELKSILF